MNINVDLNMNISPINLQKLLFISNALDDGMDS